MATYLVCLTTLMTATHLVHLTTDTPSSTSPSPAMDQPHPLILLHSVNMVSNWKELGIDFPGSTSVWEWSGLDQRYTGTQEWKNYIGSENLPRCACRHIPYANGNKTPPLIPPCRHEHYQRNKDMDTYQWNLQHKDSEWLDTAQEWPDTAQEWPGDHKDYGHTETLGTGFPKLDYNNITGMGKGVTRSDTPTVPVVVCQQRSEAESLFAYCTVAS